MARLMKHSGIEWLGDIPADWKVGRVSYFFDIQLGKMLQPEANNANDTLENYLCAVNLGGNKLKLDTLRQMWFSPSDKKKFDVRKGDLLVVEGGDVASCDIVNEDIQDVYIQNALHRVRSSAGFDVRLLRYLLIVAKAQGYIDLICNKATISHFTKEKFSAIPYPIPPLDEQQRIASFLDDKCARIDSVIEKTRASVEEYKKLKQALITRAVTKGIRPARPMKQSGIEWLGDIPSDWTTPKLSSICSVITDYVASGSFASLAENVEYLDEPDYAMLIRTADVSNKGYTPKPVYINQHAYKFLSNSNLFGGELMFPNIGASVGDVYIVPVLYERMSLAPNAIMVKTNQIDKYYYYYFQSKPGRLSIEDIAQSTTQAKFNKTDFRQLRVLLPPLDEQKEIAAYLDEKTAAIDSLVAKKNRLVEELESLKKSLIFEYVTGKKEVNQ